MAESLLAPYALGEIERLRALVAQAGLPRAQITTHAGTARFPTIADWVRTEIKGWTLAERLDDAQFARLTQAAESALSRFVTADGDVAFPAPAHIVTAAKPPAP